ncbi:bifunctional metallophosphatase/5'-nucleotidase [Pleurocapsales cyanobacterium LEGE 06147]|nr:bifunctional metallophosphatase/5'-nucleotidase [Pleurocapsales cyanobacterium LEGE 06147]
MGSGNTFTLQLFHAADQEAGIPALDDAPRFSAVLNALKDEDTDGDGNPDYPNTLILSSGDVYIPSPFFFASETAFDGQGRGDILIQNELGFQAIGIGNHEFDLGTGNLADLIQADEETDYPGTLFPFLSANLDFTTDDNLAELVTEDGQEASDIPNSLAGNTIITVDGEKIGIVGATTSTLPSISSPGDVTVRPLEFDSSNPEDIAALASEIQASVDQLLAENPDLNKVVLLAHMQQIAIEEQLAELLTDVDIIVAGGSDTLLADETDRLRPEDGVEGPYPILKTSADGNPVAIVNTDSNYKYVGRLVIDFDENGIIIPESIDPNISGAYATDEEGVLAVNGTPDPEIIEITDALREVITEQDGNIFGRTEVFLNGTRGDVRTQETNLGNLTAEANLAYAKESDSEVVISIKNGGGIRDNIGQILVPAGSTSSDEVERVPPQANELTGKEEGDISQLDIANSLRFNNDLTLLTLTAEELLEVVEHGVAETAEGATPGRFPQIAGFAFSFDASLPAGDRVQSLAIEDDEGNIIDVMVENGELVGDPDRTFRLVTLSFLADGGDGYPFPDRDRVDLARAEDAERTGEATFAPDGSEQDALAEYLVANFSETPFEREDTPPELDERIQNLDFRTDTVLEGGRDPLLGTNANEAIVGSGNEFIYSSIDDAGDVIDNFEVGSDRLVFTELLASLGYEGTDPIADGYIQFGSEGDSSIILLDPDGREGSEPARPFLSSTALPVTELDYTDNG